MKSLRYFCATLLLFIIFLPAAQAVQPTEGYLSYDTVGALHLAELPADNGALAHNDVDTPARLIAANYAAVVLRRVNSAGLIGRTVLAKYVQGRSGSLIVYDG